METAPVRDPWETPVQYVRGVGPRLAEVLTQRLEIATVGDLFQHYPRRYEDRTSFVPLGQVMTGQNVLTSGVVVGCVAEQTSRQRLTVVTVTLSDRSGRLELVFFNQPWLEKVFRKLVGRPICVYGTPQRSRTGVNIQQPEWEELTDEDDSIHVQRIVPIHGATEGMTPRMIRKMVWFALSRYLEELTDALPPAVRSGHQLLDLQEALRGIHFPDHPQHLEESRRRLAFEELFRLQTTMAMRRHSLALELCAVPLPETEPALAELRATLPFQLTTAQERCTAEIGRDLAREIPMTRLLQGDVGSGKTVVAAAAILAAVRSGCQAAVLVPTEILAEQHYTVFKRLLDPLAVRLHRLVGSVRAKGKKQIKEELASGFASVVVGTHALLQDDVEFHRLGLVVVDEQHRFGVVQRLTMLDKGTEDRVPHLLVMTATPIPRSLALTVYGDLDVSTIDELPPGRKPVRTHWKPKSERDKVHQGIRDLVARGRQVYYLCPLVEKSEKLQARAAVEVFEHLQNEVFSDLRVGLIHGQMPSHEKDTVMDQFREGELDILVATVVIEVGVDVPNASCMVIEDAERFGLAQLHQLRGRVGRGSTQSYCVLLGDPQSEDGVRRLDVLVRTHDGFEIAREDLRLRGPGEFLGTRQSGQLRLRIANLLEDDRLLAAARTAAFHLVDDDPTLAQPDHHALAHALRKTYPDLRLALTG